ncbi:hypothetical protein CsSME_00011885 [Camellia sinensis var. sinensis]
MEKGSGWLYQSVIIRLKPNFSIYDLKEELKKKGVEGVLVRDGGGRDMVVTFKSVEYMKSKLHWFYPWINLWSEYMTEWKSSLELEHERSFQIRCYGIPLNLWSVNTLKRIGSVWGEVVQLDGDLGQPLTFNSAKICIVMKKMEIINEVVNLECKGQLFPIRLCEE